MELFNQLQNKYNCSAIICIEVIQMTKEEFLNLNIIDKVNYINAELKNNKSVKDITSDLGVGKNYINQFMNKNNYVRDKDLNQYIPIAPAAEVAVVEANTKQLLNTDHIDTIDYLSENINVLIDMIDKYKAATTQTTTEGTTNYITIDLLDDKHLKPKPKSIRINEFVYQEWQVFCDKQHYSKMDLISMALKEYMEKYSK